MAAEGGGGRVAVGAAVEMVAAMAGATVAEGKEVGTAAVGKVAVGEAAMAAATVAVATEAAPEGGGWGDGGGGDGGGLVAALEWG